MLHTSPHDKRSFETFQVGDAPLVADMRMGRVNDAVRNRVPHVGVRGAPVALHAQRGLAGGILAYAVHWMAERAGHPGNIP